MHAAICVKGEERGHVAWVHQWSMSGYWIWLFPASFAADPMIDVGRHGESGYLSVKQLRDQSSEW